MVRERCKAKSKDLLTLVRNSERLMATGSVLLMEKAEATRARASKNLETRIMEVSDNSTFTPEELGSRLVRILFIIVLMIN